MNKTAIYNVTVVRAKAKRSYRVLLIDCSPGKLSEELAKILPEGWRIDSVEYDETVVGSKAFILSETYHID